MSFARGKGRGFPFPVRLDRSECESSLPLFVPSKTTALFVVWYHGTTPCKGPRLSHGEDIRVLLVRGGAGPKNTFVSSRLLDEVVPVRSAQDWAGLGDGFPTLSYWLWAPSRQDRELPLE